MARPEKTNIADGKQQKSKGKKRKHAQETEDEVATKALIVESTSTGTPLTTNTIAHAATAAHSSKSLKRKLEQQQNNVKPKKRNKSHVIADESNSDENDDEDAGPTLAQLRLAQLPENTLSIETLRQKKRQKQQQRMQCVKAQSGCKEKQRNEEYLQKWKNDKSEWRFEKLRQISIQQSIFDEQKIDGQHWPLALEYLAGTKGAAREHINKTAADILEQLDKECAQQQEETARQLILQSLKYRRARELLQYFA